MENFIEKLIYIAAACSILLILGISLQGKAPVVTSANPMKANQAQYDRIHETGWYAHNGR